MKGFPLSSIDTHSTKQVTLQMYNLSIIITSFQTEVGLPMLNILKCIMMQEHKSQKLYKASLDSSLSPSSQIYRNDSAL